MPTLSSLTPIHHITSISILIVKLSQMISILHYKFYRFIFFETPYSKIKPIPCIRITSNIRITLDLNCQRICIYEWRITYISARKATINYYAFWEFEIGAVWVPCVLFGLFGFLLAHDFFFIIGLEIIISLFYLGVFGFFGDVY